jgi:hypothetical protein
MRTNVRTQGFLPSQPLHEELGNQKLSDHRIHTFISYRAHTVGYLDSILTKCSPKLQNGPQPSPNNPNPLQTRVTYEIVLCCDPKDKAVLPPILVENER